MARETPSYVGSALLEFASRTALEVSKATLESKGAKAGDLLLLYPWLEATGKTFSFSPTATAVKSGEAQKEASGFTQGAAYVVWDGTSAIKVTWTGGASTGCVLAVDAFRNFDPSTPIDVAGAWTTFSSTKTPTAGSVTTATDHALQAIMEVNSAGSLLNKVPAGFTRRTNYSPTTLTQERAEAGSTGTTGLELVSSTSGVMLTFAIRGKEVAAAPSGLAMVI